MSILRGLYSVSLSSTTSNSLSLARRRSTTLSLLTRNPTFQLKPDQHLSVQTKRHQNSAPPSLPSPPSSSFGGQNDMSFCSHSLAPSSPAMMNELPHAGVLSRECLRFLHCHSVAVEAKFFECPTTALKLAASRLRPAVETRRFGPRCFGSSGSVSKTTVADEASGDSETKIDHGNGDGDSGGSHGGDGGGSAGGGGGEEDDEEEEFGPIMKVEEVMKEAEARGVELPSDMVEAAKAIGIRKAFLFRYLDLQGSVWPLGFLMKHCSMLRNRMLADPSFLFKAGTEVVIDSCCATLAEVQKRGKDFWAEFELYTADLLVGVVVVIALVGMLAPYARIGKPTVSKGIFGRIQHACAALPSSVFEAERPGCRFTVKQRIAAYFYKGVSYGSVGFGCGLIGQGIANMLMNAKRSLKKSEEDIPVPPLFESAALWGVFLAVSSNTRYQIVNGLERLVEASALAKQVPPVALAFTVGVRFANNIYGGMQFVDWAKWSGVQ